MKEYTKLNWSFWLSLLAFVISIVALAVFFCKVEPYSVVSIDTFIGVIAGFIGLSVTILLGYQIYNAIDLNQKINQIEKLKKSLENQQEELNKVKLEQAEGFEILQARLLREKTSMQLDSFLHLHSAIKYSLSTDHKNEGYQGLMDELELYMLDITMAPFADCSTEEDYQSKTKKLKDAYKKNDSEIRNHPNYLYIKDRYEELMSKFETRLKFISKRQNVSLTEIDKLAR